MELTELKRLLDDIPRGAKRKKIEEVADSMGISYSTLYRRMQREFGKQKRTPKPVDIATAHIEKVAALKAKSATFGNNSRMMRTEDAIEILEAVGEIPAGVLTVSTTNRRLLQMGMKQRKTCVRVEPSFANEVHYIDFSRSEYFGVAGYDASRSDFLLMSNQVALSYKNKDGKKLRLWAASVVDGYSRVRLVRYFVAANESALIGLQILNYIYCRPEDDHPLRYVPYSLRVDNGSFGKSEFAKNLFARLEIDPVPSKVGNKRAMGKVERPWRTWWSWELKQAMVSGNKGVMYLSDLNNLAFRQSIAEAQWEHPTKGGRRDRMYLASLASVEHAQRVLQSEVLELATRVVERRVGLDCRVRYNNEFYEAPQKFAGRMVRIVMNANGELIGESHDLGEKFTLKPYEFVKFGEFKGVPDTFAERAEKQFDEAMVAGYAEPEAAEKPNNIHFLPPNTQPLQPAHPMESAGQFFASIDEAKAHIGRRMGQPFGQLAFADKLEQLLQITLEKKLINELLEAN